MSLATLPCQKAVPALFTAVPPFLKRKLSCRLLPLATLVTAFLLPVGSSSFAGVAELATTPSKAVVPEKKPEANPLCFMDGKICFDIQERIRFEGRENTFDFNSDVDSLTDDAFFLNRFRIGLAYKPVNWLKFYVQGQDAQEWDSDRPDIPAAMGAEGDDNFDLRQLYVQIGTKPLSLTLGRQVLQYGDERLIG